MPGSNTSIHLRYYFRSYSLVVYTNHSGFRFLSFWI